MKMVDLLKLNNMIKVITTKENISYSIIIRYKLNIPYPYTARVKRVYYNLLFIKKLIATYIVYEYIARGLISTIYGAGSGRADCATRQWKNQYIHHDKPLYKIDYIKLKD